MAKPNLFRIDDVLIRAGAWLLFVVGAGGLLAGLVAFGGPPGTRPSLGAGWLAVAAVGMAPFALLAAGFSLRRREKRALALHRLLEHQLVVTAADLLRHSDLTRPQLARAVRDVNGAGLALLVWDPKSDQIQDARLRQSVVQVDECEACGAKISESVSLVGETLGVECPHCGTPLSAEAIHDARERLVDDIREQNWERAPAAEEAPPFSVPLFVLLALFCWPLALLYGLRRWRPQG